MKYIGNAFSAAMIEEELSVHFIPITENQYLRQRDHAKSIIGHPELAEYFDLPYNRETVRLKVGDELYIAIPKRRYREGEVVSYGDPYSMNPECVEYKFFKIQVYKRGGK